MPVNSTHPEYAAHLKKTALVRAIIDNCAQKYIREVDPSDPERSSQYRQDAILTNVTKLTRDGLVGLVFRKPATYNLPAELEYLVEDATGEGLSLDQMLPKCASEILTAGRQGLLVDYPDEVGVDVHSRIKLYASETILNFKTRNIEGRCVLSMLVLLEMIDMPAEKDQYEWNLVPQYRVLRLNQDNEYYQQVFDKNLNPISNEIYPTKQDGSRWDEIPFLFLGAENNDPAFDTIPLFDLAIINLGHYRNSADYEESIFFTGQLFPVVCVGDADPMTFKEVNPQGIRWGSRAGLILAAGGSLNLAQANPNTLVGQAMKEKLEQAAGIGARIIAPAGGRETAEAARIRYGSQNSALHVLTDNLGKGIEKALGWVCEFEGGNKNEIHVLINTDFYDDSADPNLVMAMIQLKAVGTIADADIIAYGRKTGWIEESRTDEQIASEAEVAPVAIPAASAANNKP